MVKNRACFCGTRPAPNGRSDSTAAVEGHTGNIIVFRKAHKPAYRPLAIHSIHMRDGRLERVKTIVERQQRVLTERNGKGLLSFPKIPSGLDSHRKAESSHH